MELTGLPYGAGMPTGRGGDIVTVTEMDPPRADAGRVPTLPGPVCRQAQPRAVSGTSSRASDDHAATSDDGVMDEVADSRLVDYLKDRFPGRFVDLEQVAGNARTRYGTAYARLIHLKLMQGTLRDLGLGTANNERKATTVQYEGSPLSFGWVDVVEALKCTETGFRRWRSALRTANRLYRWMRGHRLQWDTNTAHSRADLEFYEALEQFFRKERLPPLGAEEAAPGPVGGGGEVQVERRELATQQARGWAAKAMNEEVSAKIRKFGINRNTMPPAEL